MKSFPVVLVFLLTFSGAVFADGTGRMEFPATNGNVVFLHNNHVRLVQGNCKACHERPGAINGFGRAYAHEFCIGCHQPQGEETVGPITCDGCHTKN